MTYKHVIAFITAFLMATEIYANSNSLFSNKIVIGYKLDHFKPNNIDTIANKTVNNGFVEHANKQYKELKQLIQEIEEYDSKTNGKFELALVESVVVYTIFWFIGIVLFLNIIGILLIIIVKLIRGNVNNY